MLNFINLENVLFEFDYSESFIDIDVLIDQEIYRVTIQVVSNLPLASKQKFRFSMRSMY